MPFTLIHNCTSFCKNVGEVSWLVKPCLNRLIHSCESKGLSSAKRQSCLFNLNSSPFCNLLMHLECMGKQQYLAPVFLMILVSLGSRKVCTFCTFFSWGIDGRIMGKFKGLGWDSLSNKGNVEKQRNRQPATQIKTMGSSSRKYIWNCLEEYDEKRPRPVKTWQG